MQLITAPLKEPVTLFMVGIQARGLLSRFKIAAVGRAMRKMQKELRADPDSGLIWGANFIAMGPFTTLFLSYWKSSDHIDRFIEGNHFSHKAESKLYWARFGKDPNIGVWHETYEIDPNRTENLYFGMNPFGASAFMPTVKVDRGNRTFMQRLRRNADQAI